MRLAGLIIAEIAIAAIAWFPGRFIYRTINVYDQAGTIRTVEWLAFLIPVLFLIGLPIIAVWGGKFWTQNATWILIASVGFNILFMVFKWGWFFGRLG